MQSQQQQIQTAMFEYEIKEDHLNLYDRVDKGKYKGILRFLVQVPYQINGETSVRVAVDEVYRHIENRLPHILSIRAEHINSGGFHIDYLRTRNK
jgi:hypothetical protein